jgi:glycolate oxidase FAD binding subunit
MAQVARALQARWFYDWSGGLVWLATDPAGDAGAATIRGAVATQGGHATLVRAPAEVRAAVDVFEPQPAPLMRVTRDIKAAFDPAGVLNPGRMYAGV